MNPLQPAQHSNPAALQTHVQTKNTYTKAYMGSAAVTSLAYGIFMIQKHYETDSAKIEIAASFIKGIGGIGIIVMALAVAQIWLAQSAIEKEMRDFQR